MSSPRYLLLSGSVQDSFAYATIKDRLPTILTKLIDSICRRETRLKDSQKNKLINLICGLKYEITRDKKLKFKVDALAEVEKEPFDERQVQTDPIEREWKWEIEKLQQLESDTWFKAPWLTVECLLYKHLYDISLATVHRENQPYDVFEHLKMESLDASMAAISEITDQYLNDIVKSMEHDTDDSALKKLIELSLWGNQADLSLSFKNHHDDSKMDHSERIIVNDMEKVVDQFKKSKKVTFILDNAGFEQFSDLCLADYLSSTFNISIVMECKSFPWFVSDVVEDDFSRLFDKLSSHSDATEILVNRWKAHLESGKWKIQSNPFWTTFHPYWKLPNASVFQELCKSDFLIFKGDLNYRKVFENRVLISFIV